MLILNVSCIFLTKERFGIQRIEVYGKASISQLRISLDGVSFDSVDAVVNDEESNASYFIALVSTSV